MCIAAIDMGGTKTMIGLITAKGEVLEKFFFPTILTSYTEHFSYCLTVLNELLTKHNFSMSDVEGIGINVPGMIDETHTRLKKAVFSGWTDIPVKEYFVNKTGIQHVRIENDVNSCAIGELAFGYKQTYKNFLWLTVSTGVGGAVVCDGKLVTGAKSCAGEFGHLKVEFENPRRCPCGQYGCLEAQGSGTAITNYTKELAALDSDFQKAFDRNQLSVDAKGCAELAFAGNVQAMEIYKKAAIYLGRGISYGVNILNPEAVIIGGGVSCSLDLMAPTIKQVLDENVITNLLPVDIVQTKLGYDAALLGAAALCL